MFDTLIVLLKELFEKVYFEKKSAEDNRSMKNYPQSEGLSPNCLQRLSADNKSRH